MCSWKLGVQNRPVYCIGEDKSHYLFQSVSFTSFKSVSLNVALPALEKKESVALPSLIECC